MRWYSFVRAIVMGLAAQFDLDLFMTGYDLWATQAAVRAAAHYDLAHSPATHTVSALLLVWDGAQLLADDGPLDRAERTLRHRTTGGHRHHRQLPAGDGETAYHRTHHAGRGPAPAVRHRFAGHSGHAGRPAARPPGRTAARAQVVLVCDVS